MHASLSELSPCILQLSESFLKGVSSRHGAILERCGQPIEVKGKGLMKTYYLRKKMAAREERQAVEEIQAISKVQGQQDAEHSKMC